MSQVIFCALFFKQKNKQTEDKSLANAEGGKCCAHAVHIKTQNRPDNPNAQRGNAACCSTKIPTHLKFGKVAADHPRNWRSFKKTVVIALVWTQRPVRTKSYP